MSRWTDQGNCIFLRRDDGYKISASGALWDWPECGENKIMQETLTADMASRRAGMCCRTLNFPTRWIRRRESRALHPSDVACRRAAESGNEFASPHRRSLQKSSHSACGTSVSPPAQYSCLSSAQINSGIGRVGAQKLQLPTMMSCKRRHPQP